jgi:drug/metabolite transporter (DMT)-like permease
VKSAWKAHLAIFTANFIYGANYSVAKGIMPAYFGPFAIILLRVTGAIALFFLMFVGKREKIAKEDYGRFFLCGLTGVAINQLMFFKGLSMTSPIEAAIILTASPILVLIVAALLAKERITISKSVGIGLGLIGALILISQRPATIVGEYSVWGNLMILTNAISYAFFLVLVRPLMQKYRVSTVMLFVFLIGLIPVIPISFHEFTLIEWSIIPSWAFWGLSFIIVGTTFLAYLLNAYGLVTVSASVVSSYIYLQPFLAAAVAMFIGKDSLDFSKIISAALVFTGVYLTSRPAKSKNKLEKV